MRLKAGEREKQTKMQSRETTEEYNEIGKGDEKTKIKTHQEGSLEEVKRGQYELESNGKDLPEEKSRCQVGTEYWMKERGEGGSQGLARMARFSAGNWECLDKTDQGR